MKIEKLFLYLTIQIMFLFQLQILGPLLSSVYLETLKSPHDIAYFLLGKYTWHGSGFFLLNLLNLRKHHAPKRFSLSKLKFSKYLISSILQKLKCLEFLSLGLSYISIKPYSMALRNSANAVNLLVKKN